VAKIQEEDLDHEEDIDQDQEDVEDVRGVDREVVGLVVDQDGVAVDLAEAVVDPEDDPGLVDDPEIIDRVKNDLHLAVVEAEVNPGQQVVVVPVPSARVMKIIYQKTVTF